MNWRDRFRAPVVIAAKVARDNPTRGVVITDVTGSFQAMAWDRTTDELHQVSASEGAVLSAAISHDGGEIFTLVEETRGTEMGHIHAFPFDGSDSVDLTPGLEPFPVYDYHAIDGGVLAVGAADGAPALVVARDGEFHAVPTPGIPFGLAVSEDAAQVAVATPTPGRGLVQTLTIMAIQSGEVLGTYEEMSPGVYKGSDLAVSHLTGDWMRPGVVRNGTFQAIEVDIPGDVMPVDWSKDGSTILLNQSYRSKGGLWLYLVATGETVQLDGPEGAFHPFASVSLIDDRTALTVWSSANQPWRAVEISTDGWKTAVAVGDAVEFDGPLWEEFEFPTTDGVIAQGWLLRPAGDGPFPTVIYTHGGPTAVASPSFSTMTSAWFDHGYAVASVNYRGSMTFGSSYQEALSGSIGGPDVDDVIAARSYLIEAGIADPGRIVKNGYSYGGYLTLQCLGVHPEGWLAGVAGAPIADWAVMFDEQNAFTKAYALSLFGGTPDDLPELYQSSSPRSHVANYSAPLHISQPENDSRTPFKPVRMFVDDMQAADKEVDLFVMAGGHAGVGKTQTIEMVERWLSFVDDVISRAE